MEQHSISSSRCTGTSSLSLETRDKKSEGSLQRTAPSGAATGVYLSCQRTPSRQERDKLFLLLIPRSRGARRVCECECMRYDPLIASASANEKRGINPKEREIKRRETREEGGRERSDQVKTTVPDEGTHTYISDQYAGHELWSGMRIARQRERKKRHALLSVSRSLILFLTSPNLISPPSFAACLMQFANDSNARLQG